MEEKIQILNSTVMDVNDGKVEKFDDMENSCEHFFAWTKHF